MIVGSAIVSREYALGGRSTFEAADAADFARMVLADRRTQRRGGDTQGITYSVAGAAAAAAIGAEDTVGGWYVRAVDVLLGVQS